MLVRNAENSGLLRHHGGRGRGGRQQVVLPVELELVAVGVGEVEELPDRRLVAAGAEGHDVVVHAEGRGQRAVLARDRRGGVVGRAQRARGLDDRDHRGRAEHHAHPALCERRPHVLAVGGARARLRVAGLRELAHERQRLHVLRAVDGVAAAAVHVAAAVAEEPQQRLGLCFLAAERHAVPDVALGLDRRGVGPQLRPGLRRRRDPGLGEDLLVVVQRPGAGGERDAVIGALVLAVLEEGRHEVVQDGGGEHLAVGVQQVALGELRGRVPFEDVGELLVLDQRLDLVREVGPVHGLDVDRDAWGWPCGRRPRWHPSTCSCC